MDTMRKLLFFAFFLSMFFVSEKTIGQHFVPLKLSISPDEFNMAAYGGLSLDRGNEPGFLKSLSNTGQTGFIVNAMYTKKGGERFSQFMLDINPIIIDWDPFTWNKLVSQPVDSFYVDKLPYAEDAFLHIGWHYNRLNRIRGTRIRTEFTAMKIFTDFYFRPYSIDKNSQNFRFATYNISSGFQFAYVKKEVPLLGNYLIGASISANAMLINEPPNYDNSFAALMNNQFTDKNVIGPGFKLTVQTNYLNIYVDMRQYYGLDTGDKFTKMPLVLVGAFGNLHWISKKNKTNTIEDDTPPVLE